MYEDYGIVLCSLVASNVKTVRFEIMAAVSMDMVFRSTLPYTLVEIMRIEVLVALSINSTF